MRVTVHLRGDETFARAIRRFPKVQAFVWTNPVPVWPLKWLGPNQWEIARVRTQSEGKK
jgi:hypothetical protein